MLVEDDPEHRARAVKVLEDAGFQVRNFAFATQALAAASSLEQPTDLIVLDRKLPQEERDEPEDATGDRLLEALLPVLPSSAFVTFSGFTGMEHQQFATRTRGVVPLEGDGADIDRVTSFAKQQSLDFKRFVRDLAERLKAVDDIELLSESAVTEAERRVLKRVALYLGARSVSAERLFGGLTTATVWRCGFSGNKLSGGALGTVIVKVVKYDEVAPRPEGMSLFLPASLVAARLASISGFCGGWQAQVLQLAGAEADSLFTVLENDDERAARALSVVVDAYRQPALRGVPDTRTFAELCQPLFPYERLAAELAKVQVPVPRRSLQVSVRQSPQHGDLHPGNVLVVRDHPVLIDLDSEVSASCLLDPVTALLSPLFHRDSPGRTSTWPTDVQCLSLGEPAYFDASPYAHWSREAWKWLQTAKTSDREVWSLVLIYAAKQLKYPDVSEDPLARRRATALAEWACSRLTGS